MVEEENIRYVWSISLSHPLLLQWPNCTLMEELVPLTVYLDAPESLWPHVSSGWKRSFIHIFFSIKIYAIFWWKLRKLSTTVKTLHTAGSQDTTATLFLIIFFAVGTCCCDELGWAAAPLCTLWSPSHYENTVNTTSQSHWTISLQQRHKGREQHRGVM